MTLKWLVVMMLVVAASAVPTPRRRIPSGEPSVREAVAYARLIGAEVGFANMYWPDRLVWTEYVNEMENAYIAAAEEAKHAGGHSGPVI